MKLTTLLVSYNTEALLEPCLAALDVALADVQPNRIIAVDNASRDRSVETLERDYPDVHLIRSEKNIGFGRANNLALPLIESPYLLLLNTDAFVPANALVGPLEYMRSHPDCGILGVKLIGRDGVLQPSCRYFPTPLNLFAGRTGLLRRFAGRMVDDMDWDHSSIRECDWVPGCFYLVRREAVDKVGLFDPRYFLYFEEVDHCMSVKKAGWKVVYYPDVCVVHIGGESAKSMGSLTDSGKQLAALQTESAMLFFRKSRGIPGFLSFTLLDMLADVLLLANSVRRNKGGDVRTRLFSHLRQTLALSMRTRFGSVPTR